MGNLLPLIIQLVSGAVGGNIAGSLNKDFSLSALLNYKHFRFHKIIDEKSDLLIV